MEILLYGGIGLLVVLFLYWFFSLGVVIVTLVITFILGCIFFGVENTFKMIGILIGLMIFLAVILETKRYLNRRKRKKRTKEKRLQAAQNPPTVVFPTDIAHLKSDTDIQYCHKNEEENFEQEDIEEDLYNEIDDISVLDYGYSDIDKLETFIELSCDYDECKDHITPVVLIP